MPRERRQPGRLSREQMREPVEIAPSAPSTVKPDDRFKLWEYALVNLIFWAFCMVQYVVVRVVTRETLGLMFFFSSLAIGFSVVSVLSWCFDRFFPEKDTEDTC